MNHVFLFDWGDTLMRDDLSQTGPMWQWPTVHALPGAVEALQWAQAHGRVGIASGASDSDEDDIRAALVRVGLARFIDIIFCRKTLGFSKTDPRFWQTLIARLGVPARHICMIGDSYQADVLAPSALGIHAIWFNWRQEPAHPCPTITTLQELPQMIGADLLEFPALFSHRSSGADMPTLNEQFASRLARLGIRIPEALLPKAGTDLAKWSVVACDQYTSDHAYWNQVEALVGDAPSTLRITLPEIFLEQPGIEGRISAIHAAMADYMARGILENRGEAITYIKRTTAHSGTREGLLFAMDLERYSYARDSKSLIRATEGTIVDRIPPRLAVRRAAPLELPHIMILIDDAKRELIEGLATKVADFEPAYDVELMQHGGHLQGWRISKPEQVDSIITGLEKLLDQTIAAQKSEEPLFFAMGDGNHSLATAKARWEETKAELAAAGKSQDEILAHPARFALAEIVNIHSPGLLFEPIHRVVFTQQVAALTAALQASEEVASVTPIAEANLQALLASPQGQDKAGYFDGQQYFAIAYKPEVKKLPPALVDELFARFKQSSDAAARIDFIHGWEDNKKLAAEGAGCFFLPVIARDALIGWVQENGPLPRKSFSMGDAEEKRYYMEARRITL